MCRITGLLTLFTISLLTRAVCAQVPAQYVVYDPADPEAILIDGYELQPVEFELSDEQDAADASMPQESEYCADPAIHAQPTCDCIWCRDKLLGDMHCVRSSLAGHGIVWDGQLTQFHQGVLDGGNEQTFRYGGKLDQFMIFNFAQMGLCEHLTGVMHVETRFGESVIQDAVLLAPVNTAMLYPQFNENDTAITALQFELALTDECSAVFGKFNAIDFLYMVYPQTGRGVDGFMNTSLITPLTIARTIPLSFLGAGVVTKKEQQIQSALLVYDSNNITTTSGFDVLFDNGANILGFYRVFTNHCGLPGAHSVLGTYASGDYTDFDPLGWAIIPGGGVVAPEVAGSWSVEYIFEQKLWIDPCNQQRNLGLFSQWGYADPETCPFEWTMNVSVQGQGLLCCRENDTMGAGFFYSGVSDELENLLQATVPVDDLQGVELYYNAEITPWFHLTADLQVIEPAVQANDTAVVFGLRGKIDL